MAKEDETVSPAALLARMDELGVIQDEIAVHLDVSQGSVSRWLSGSRPLSPGRAREILAYLDSVEKGGQRSEARREILNMVLKVRPKAFDLLPLLVYLTDEEVDQVIAFAFHLRNRAVHGISEPRHLRAAESGEDPGEGPPGRTTRRGGLARPEPDQHA